MAPADPTLEDDDDAFLYGDSEEDVPAQPGEYSACIGDHLPLACNEADSISDFVQLLLKGKQLERVVVLFGVVVADCCGCGCRAELAGPLGEDEEEEEEEEAEEQDSDDVSTSQSGGLRDS